MKSPTLITCGALAFSMLTSGVVFGEQLRIGELEYKTQCAVCHGTDGKGSGPYIEFLNKSPSDLTTLAQRHKGRFPFQHVYDVIDGSQSQTAHGPRDMPIWGSRYAMEIIEEYGPYTTDHPETVHARILSLVFYLGTIQE
ncbi:cytochrome c [Pontibacterium granulatum]|uniref:c-type cytochrome n=1 Tax=Pontibacterium granulatum TaxID=2036029 RepID=UPI00249C1B6A|nr:cytochrome c [Pontibacterium granulatum]MDI3325671.1 cytochrome c [Pontibacterium granulatum]